MMMMMMLMMMVMVMTGDIISDSLKYIIVRFVFFCPTLISRSTMSIDVPLAEGWTDPDPDPVADSRRAHTLPRRGVVVLAVVLAVAAEVPWLEIIAVQHAASS